jgi:Flp pilus assembly pilin Flp
MRHLASVVARGVQRFADDDEGQDLVEYGLLASLISTFVLGALGLVSDQINGVLWAAIAAAQF